MSRVLEAHEDTLSERKPNCRVNRGLAVSKNQYRLAGHGLCLGMKRKWRWTGPGPREKEEGRGGEKGGEEDRNEREEEKERYFLKSTRQT